MPRQDPVLTDARSACSGSWHEYIVLVFHGSQAPQLQLEEFQFQNVEEACKVVVLWLL